MTSLVYGPLETENALMRVTTGVVGAVVYEAKRTPERVRELARGAADVAVRGLVVALDGIVSAPVFFVLAVGDVAQNVIRISEE